MIDKFDKQQYVFKVNHEASLKKLSSFLKKNENMKTSFTFRKECEPYIKVKPCHIKGFNDIAFVKNHSYKSVLNLVYYEYLDKKGFYPKISFVEESSSSSDLEE